MSGLFVVAFVCYGAGAIASMRVAKGSADVLPVKWFIVLVSAWTLLFLATTSALLIARKLGVK